MFIKVKVQTNVILTNDNIFSESYHDDLYSYFKYEQGYNPPEYLEYQEITEEEFSSRRPEPSTPPEPQPTEQDLLNAQILLNQAEQDAKLKEIDEALALILLNQEGGIQNVL